VGKPGKRWGADRIVFFQGMTVFVELKAPGKKPTPLQIARHKELAKLGQKVLVLDSKESVDEFMEKVEGGMYEVCTP